MPLLAEAGTPLKTISTTMGHAKSSITLDTYQHTDPSAQRAAIDRLEMLLLGKSNGQSNKASARPAIGK
jgi:integrase